jgi:flagellin-like hook-associated protein FlgL
MLSGITALNPGFLSDLNNIENRIATENSEISSGIRVNQPSDDPGAIASILESQSQIDQVTQVQTNLNLANVSAQTADGALQNASSLLDQLTSLATQGASSTTNTTSDSALALQVQNIQQELVSIANTNINGQYVFGGDNSATAPYTFNWSNPNGVTQQPAQVSLSGNLQSGSTAYSQNISVVDSLGQTHTLTVTLTPSGSNTWSYNVTVPAADLSTTQATSLTTNGSTSVTVASTTGISVGQSVTGTGIPSGTTVASIDGNTVTLSAAATATGIGSLGFGTPSPDPQALASGTLTFNSNGTLSSSATSPVVLNLNNLADGAENMTVNWKLFDSSGNGLIVQTAQPSSLTAETSVSTNTAVLRDASGNETVPGMLASQIFDAQGASGGPGIFAVVYSLGQALQSGNQSLIEQAAVALKSATTQLNAAEVRNGDLEDWISQANQDASSRLTNLQGTLSTLRDTDIPNVAIQLTTDETALNAAISAHATLSNKTLFDYLG